MSVGFRPHPEDNKLIEAHRRPGESTTDVLRRALRALDREQWDQQAREDMERIAASGEDLSDEPDDWGYDEDGKTVDLRDSAVADPLAPANDGTGEVSLLWIEPKADPGSSLSTHSSFFTPQIKAIQGASNLFTTKMPSMSKTEWSKFSRALEQITDPVRGLVITAAALEGCALEMKPPKKGTDPEFEAAIAGLGLHTDAAAARPAEPKEHTPTPPKLARLRAAAARRASKR